MRETNYLEPTVSIPALAGQTKNFSGAEIAGLIRSATSFALNRKVDIQDLGKSGDLGEIKITNDDFENALAEVKPSFGVHADEFENCIGHGMMAYSRDYESALRSCKSLVDQVRCSENTPLLTLLLHGPTGCGKTALAAHLARTSDYPFVRRIAAENYVGYTEQAKVSALAKIFEDAYKSPLSVVVLDDLERLMDYVRVGPRFSNLVLQAMFAMLKRQPKKEHHRLLVIGTSSEPGFLEEVELFQSFNVAIRVPMLSAPEHFKLVLSKLPGFTAEAVQEISEAVQGQQIGIRTLLLIAEMAVNRQNPVQREVFMDCLQQCGCV
jgi:vesicle-fusing ATPase